MRRRNGPRSADRCSSKKRKKIATQDCRKTPSNGLAREPPLNTSGFDRPKNYIVITDSIINFSFAKSKTGLESASYVTERHFARLSLPPQLRIAEDLSKNSEDDDEEEGAEESESKDMARVVCRTPINMHSRFGPLQGEEFSECDITKETDFRYLWRVSDTRYVYTSDPETSNWFRYIRPAPDKDRSNCIWTSDEETNKGYLFTTRDLRVGEELLFWTDWAWNEEVFNKIPSKTNCGGCNIAFPHILYYALHCRVLHDPRYSLTIRKYHCKICEIGILGKENFVRHLTDNHRGEGGHQCGFCKKYFLRQAYLETHRNYGCSLNPERSVPLCDLCGKKFSQPQKLKTHKRRMHGKTSNLKDFECEICGKVLCSTQGLIRHKREVHHKTEKYECEKCGKAFTNKSNLKIHLLTHSKVKPFGCRENDCSQRFTTKQCLQFHYLKIHNKARHEVPDIERDVPYTIEAYSGREEERDKNDEGSMDDEEESKSFDEATAGENERIDVGSNEEIDLLPGLLSSSDKPEIHPPQQQQQIPSYTVNDIIGHTGGSGGEEAVPSSDDEEEEENSFYEFPESTFNLGEAASINRPQIQVPIPAVQSHFDYEDNVHHHRNSSSFFHSFSDFSSYYHPHSSFYSAFPALTEEAPTDFTNHLYGGHHATGEMTFQNYYGSQHQHHRFGTPGHIQTPTPSYYSYF